MYFNPRSHERSDEALKLELQNVSISIHAPTRGATERNHHDSNAIRFQSTLPREERPHAMVSYIGYIVFQSTLPREERPSKTMAARRQMNFNPRSHERSDKTTDMPHRAHTSFQSTLPREERRVPGTAASNKSIFQSTLPREERRRQTESCTTYTIFQSTLPREERPRTAA